MACRGCWSRGSIAAQARNHFLFQALFVVPAPGVHYQGVFGGEYNVPALEGLPSSLGCTIPPPVLDPMQPHDVPANLLAWDVTTAVSETYISVGGKYIDSLANAGCGSIKGEYSRMSLLPYDLEITPDTWGPTVESETPLLTPNNDAVFGRLVGSLIGDLGYVFSELACKAVDNPNAAPPLSPTTARRRVRMNPIRPAMSCTGSGRSSGVACAAPSTGCV